MSVKLTYFVHGTTIDNENGICTGWKPGELSKLGVQQAENLKNQINLKSYDVIYCSDLKRAIDSAELCFGHTHAILKDSRLREANYGILNGAQESKFEESAEWYIDNPFPEGESYKDVEIRIREFLGDINKKYSGQHIAIVAHKAPQLALEVILKNKTWKEAIKEDWRKTKSWKPGWEYIVCD